MASNNEDYFGVVYKPSFSSTAHSVRKYLQAKDSVTQKADGDINYTAIRFAEVLLWEAEALTELNRLNALSRTEAVKAPDHFKDVREKSGRAGATSGT